MKQHCVLCCVSHGEYLPSIPVFAMVNESCSYMKGGFFHLLLAIPRDYTLTPLHPYHTLLITLPSHSPHRSLHTHYTLHTSHTGMKSRVDQILAMDINGDEGDDVVFNSGACLLSVVACVYVCAVFCVNLPILVSVFCMGLLLVQRIPGRELERYFVPCILSAGINCFFISSNLYHTSFRRRHPFPVFGV